MERKGSNNLDDRSMRPFRILLTGSGASYGIYRNGADLTDEQKLALAGETHHGSASRRSMATFSQHHQALLPSPPEIWSLAIRIRSLSMLLSGYLRESDSMRYCVWERAFASTRPLLSKLRRAMDTTESVREGSMRRAMAKTRGSSTSGTAKGRQCSMMVEKCCVPSWIALRW